ncbi:dTDP-4-dehydrorhamnose reductase [Rhodobacter maris]|uniref:dTDP-4-dehydrorhamnose reductase n=1 Tax=Rhodobacter maris TaxID=446682 RepID=A0A285TAA4_9RHOB|nr:dTDP-4-dehydrorhamnose reductase [Rhodobacter maris]SOC18172.1 dTDP-4-dehydrorhamnose reductase [Rhodobacter maris]
MMLVFGQTGQVARAFQVLAPEALYLGREAADLMNPEACAAAIRAAKPDVVINAAAWTAVDKAETEEAAATQVNGAAPSAMAEACAALAIPFVHISTDYVFDGSGEAPFAVDAPTAPLGAYGRSKLAGEEGVRAAGGCHAILRTSWVVSADGTNFVKTMLRLSETREKLTIVADQIGGPTPARAIAVACLEIARQLSENPAKSGTYHFSGAPDVSWADFAREIFVQAGRTTVVEDIPSSAYPTPARRPANSRLDCSRTAEVFGINRPNWKTGLSEILKILEGAK